MNKNEYPVIMIVDDSKTYLDILVNTLSPDYELQVIDSGQTALQIIEKGVPDLILLDVLMPDINGYEVCRKLKSNPRTKDIPIIFLTAMTSEFYEAKGLEMGAVDYITKPFLPELVKKRVKNQLDLKKYRDHLEKMVEERTREVQLIQDITIETMGALAEYRDPETGDHIKRIQHYVKLLANTLAKNKKYTDVITKEFVNILYKSAPLHDIGKVGVRDSILLKPGKLTTQEFEEMKKHTIYGWNVIRQQEKKVGEIAFLKMAKEITYTHHERWDGNGYPRGLSGNNIPLSGRIMAVADVYDALVSKRVYKPKFSHEKAASIVREGRGSHFDPEVIDAFDTIELEFKNISEIFDDSKLASRSAENEQDDALKAHQLKQIKN